MAHAMWLGATLTLLLLGSLTQLDLDCARPESARALIDYAQLSEIEQVEDIHRDELDHALQRCPLALLARSVGPRNAVSPTSIGIARSPR